MEDLDRKILEACRLYANGKQPAGANRVCGLCYAVALEIVGPDDPHAIEVVQNRMGLYFFEMDMHPKWPLGYQTGDKWEGEKGEQRRGLARRIVELLEGTAA